MQRRLIIITLLFTLILPQKNFGKSGEGTPFITNINYINNQQNYIWGLTQASQGSILIAGKTGLLEFDSESWSTIETPDVVLTLKSSDFDSKTYVAGRNFFGYIDVNNKGQLKYYSLSQDSIIAGFFNKIIETENSVWIYGPNNLFCYNKTLRTLSKKHIKTNNLFAGIVNISNDIYLNIANEGWYSLNDTNEKFISSKNIFINDIVFSTPFYDNNILIGTDIGDLFLFNGSKFTPYQIENREFIKTGILSDGVSIDSNRLALSTKNFGVIIIEKKSGKTLHIINSESGLPSDNIMGLFVDKDKGLWIAHAYGLSRMDSRLPMSYYSSYSGLTSNILALNYWNEDLYVATSTGVYTLDSINRYTSKEIVKRIPIKTKPATQYTDNKKQPVTIERDKNEEADQSKKDKNTQEIEKEEKKGFFRRLFSKDKDETTENQNIKNKPANENKSQNLSNERPRQRYQYLKYNEYVVKSKDYGFSLVERINKKCKLFIAFSDALLAITESEIYSIDRQKEVSEIFSAIHIYTVVKSNYHKNVIYVVSEKGIFTGTLKNNKWEFSMSIASPVQYNITDIAELDPENFLLAFSDEVYLYNTTSDSSRIIPIDNPYAERVVVKSGGGKNYLIIGNKLYAVDYVNGTIDLKSPEDIHLVNFFANQPDNLWLKTEKYNFKYFGTADIPENIFSFLRVFEDLTDIFIDDAGNIWVIDGFEHIYKLNTDAFANYSLEPHVIIKQIKTIKGDYLNLNQYNVKYADNALTFNVVSPTYLMFNTNQYQYKIEGLMEKWSEWSMENNITVPYFPPGTFKFMVRSRDIFGHISNPVSYEFKITPPFWQTPYFFIGVIVLIIATIYFRQRYKIKRHLLENEKLKEKVKERTIELELRNKSITDSIVYAERIQNGMLPTDEVIQSCLTNYFLLYKPRNIVSGDFYFITKKENITFVVAADCTGHGVPGAFMSMLGIAYLNEIVRKSSSGITAADVLEKLRERLMKLFSQETFKTNDGMDIALLVINSNKMTLQYAGAYNPLYIVTSKDNRTIDTEKISGDYHNKLLLVYKGDRFHVGKAVRGLKKFKNHVIPFTKEDTFYIFSDGFVDQFGGPEESKFKYGPFKQLILEISDYPIEEQGEILLTRFREWKGDYEQTDDILIWGLKP